VGSNEASLTPPLLNEEVVGWGPLPAYASLFRFFLSIFYQKEKKYLWQNAIRLRDKKEIRESAGKFCLSFKKK
jgi:hypothetical protein